jgi:NADPH:quinone reductase-like Zn-dependent oxidoreductase
LSDQRSQRRLPSPPPSALPQTRSGAAELPGTAAAVVEVRALALCPYAEITRLDRQAGPSDASIVSVGVAGVVVHCDMPNAPVHTGDEVWSRVEVCDPCAVSQMTLPAETLARVPVGITLEQAATLGDSGLMALVSLLEGAINSTTKLLVHGGANPFGSAAVALAAFLGAEAYATVASKNEIPIALAAGAKHASVAHGRDEVRELKRAIGTRGFDLVLDGALTEHIGINVDVLAAGGTILTCPLKGRDAEHGNRDGQLSRGFARLAAKGGSVRFLRATQLMKYDFRKLTEQINRAVATRYFRPLVGQVLTPAELPEAIQHLEHGRLIGNLVLRPT